MTAGAADVINSSKSSLTSQGSAFSRMVCGMLLITCPPFSSLFHTENLADLTF